MRLIHWSSPFAAIAIQCCAGVALASPVQQQPLAATRDPDRGLAPELRARLALLDAHADSWVVEQWNAAIQPRLDEIAARWAAGGLETDLSKAAWIAPKLRVAPLFAAPPPSAPDERGWRVRRGLDAPDAARERETLPRALADWRGCFAASSRLDFEVIGFNGEPPRIEAQVRVSASGVAAESRAQHDALWSTAWQLADGAAELVDVRVEEFTAVALGPASEPAFADVTESLFADPRLYRERFAPGLEHWCRELPATLFPGTLGHHGLAIADVDGDGLEDLYVCRPGGLPNQLLLQTREHRVIDASAAAGVDLLDYSSSALLVDLDGDADADLVVATGTGLAFFANDGAAHFERTLLLERSLPTSLAAADYDRDGDVDLYVCSYLSPFERDGLPVPYFDANNGVANSLLRNDGGWSFSDVTAEVGLDENNRRFSFAAAWEDFDNDGDQDLYVANDFGRKNLYRNQGGRFDDVAPELAVEDAGAGMGVAWGDVDHDGWMDLYVTNMHSPAGCRLTSRADFRSASTPAARAALRAHARGNTLFSNRGGGAFRDVSVASGTSFGRWGWGAIFVDFDNDGALDLYAPNGFVSGERGPDLDSFFWRQVVLQSPDGADDPSEPSKNEHYKLGWRAVNRLVRQGRSWNGHERNVALWNTGGGRFADVSAAIGLDHADDSRAAARIDWDGDGDEELLVTNRTSPMLRLLDNRQRTEHAWIAFELRAADRKRTTIGSRVEVEASDGRRHSRTLRCGEGFMAQSSSRVHFGLGRAAVKRVRVRWAGGELEEFGSPASGSAHLLVQGSGTASAIAARGDASLLRASSPCAPARADVARTVLPVPLPLPRLAMDTPDGQRASLFGMTMQGPQGTGQPLVVLAWSATDDSSRDALARAAADASALREAGLHQILALNVDVGPKAREQAIAAWNEVAWPFARAFATEESVSVLELVLAALHDDAHGLTLPAAFLIDARGRVAATYQGRVEPEAWRNDLRLLALDASELRDACVPFPGRWIAPRADALDADVAARLAAHGLDRAAAEYELAKVETRELTVASFEYEAAVAYHKSGRPGEAIARYRRALAADAAHALAAQGLAVALHEQGELAAALVAYKEALKLEPAHGPTRFNLGVLHLARREVAAAEAELQSLRALKSEHAPALEQLIREHVERK